MKNSSHAILIVGTLAIIALVIMLFIYNSRQSMYKGTPKYTNTYNENGILEDDN